MNELVSAALERCPVPEMETEPEASVSDERMETNKNDSHSPPPSERTSRPETSQSQSGAPSSRSPHDNENNENDADADADDTREARTPPHAFTERRAHPTEQRYEYRSSPPPPPSLSSAAAAKAAYYPHHHHPHQNSPPSSFAHPHQQQQPHPHRQRHHQGENPGYYHSSPPHTTHAHARSISHAGAGGVPPSRHQHLRGSPPPAHPRTVLPSVTDSYRSGGCTCKKSRCLKLYCQCFSSSTTCGPKCKCVACHNTTLHADSIEKARHLILERNSAAFDDKFQKPVKHDHLGVVVYGHDIFATKTTTAAASSAALEKSWTASSMRHQQHLQHHMPYTFAQQQKQLSPAQPPLLSSSTTTSPPTARASTTTASSSSSSSPSPPPSSYSYTPPPYASSHSAGLPFCLPPVPPPPLQSKRVNKFGCKCKRSFCLKKYCECFQNQTHCGLYCKCTNCKNFPEDPNQEKGDASAACGTVLETCGTVLEIHMATMTATTVPQTKTNRTPVTVPITSAAGEKVAQTRPVLSMHNTDNDTLPDKQPDTQHQELQDKDEDRMAMMAAVAMAELSGASFAGEKQESYSSLTPTAPRRISNEREFSQDHAGGSNKRKAEENETLSSVPLKKRKPTEHLASLADEEVRAVSSTSPMSAESRNPSPVSTMRSHYYPQQADRFPYHHGMPPQTGRYQSHGPHGASPVHHRDPRASPPPPYEYNRVVSSLYLQPSPPPTFRSSPPPYVRSSPPPYARSSPPPIGMYNNGVTPSPFKQTGGSYDDIVRSSGLPKALSFRKICSKCGKTRGEHGDRFGNKCVYQECGKCGAGQHMHERAGQPMGVLCCLTVENGATPLASALYERKIRELAARADMQRELQRRKEEATQDIVQRCEAAEAEASANMSAAAAMEQVVEAEVQ